MCVPKPTMIITDEAFFLIAVLELKLVISINEAFDARSTIYLPFEKAFSGEILICQIRKHSSSEF